MRRAAPWSLVLLLALSGDGWTQPAPVSRTFANPIDRVWFAVQLALAGQGWKIEETDPAAGRMVTDVRSVDFKEFGVYGVGTRHLLRVTVQAAGQGGASVAVERELFREERLLWTSSRKPVETTDRSVEATLLDAIQAALPAPESPPPEAERSPPVDVRPSRTIASPTYKVTYRVKGTAGRVALTYRNREGGTEQSVAPLPWQVSFDARAGSFLYVSAQNQDTSGSVTCEILLEEVTRSTTTASGAYVIAECANAAERP
jgi:hypothetical protein